MAIKEGDKIRVKRDIARKIGMGEVGGTTGGMENSLYFNNYSMKQYEGEEFEVEELLRDRLEQIRLKGIEWTWREDWLEQVIPIGLEGAVKLT